MKLFLDQDVYWRTAEFLRSLGHDVLRASDVGLSRAKDEDLLRYALKHGRIFITRDRDFGHLVFVRGMRVGVIYLRINPTTLEAVHRELERVLEKYSEGALRSAFVVVEADKHRYRKIDV